MLGFKGYIPTILVVLIIGGSYCYTATSQKDREYSYGWQKNRIMESRLAMNCKKNNLAVYNEFAAFRFRPTEYELLFEDHSDIGISAFGFGIKFHSNIDVLTAIEGARISFCREGKEYIGMGNPKHSSSIPGVCHFYYIYDEHNFLKLGKEDILWCHSREFLTEEEYAEKELSKPQ